MAYEVAKYPEYKGQNSALGGKNFLLYLAYDGKWQLIGGCRSNGLSISSDSIDSSSKDDLGWGSSLPGTKQWTSSLELVMKNNNETLRALENWVFYDELQQQRPALHICFVNAVTKEYYEGWAVANNFEISGEYSDVCLVSTELSGVGALTRAEGFVAETKDGETMTPDIEYTE